MQPAVSRSDVEDTPRAGRQSQVVRRARWLAAVAILAACGWLSQAALRTWRADADQQGAKALAANNSVAEAQLAATGARARPDLAGPWRLQAEAASFSHPRRALGYAHHSVVLDPGDWRNWRALGLIEFRLGRLSAARQAFAHGVRVDHGFASHFELGNLALLTGDTESFWRQMRAALAIAPADRVNAVLQQALGADPSGRRLPAIFPRHRPAVDAQAIIFLVTHRHLRAATAAWRDLRCPTYDRKPCRAAALQLVDTYAYRAYGGGASANVGTAMQIWNQAVAQGALRQPRARIGVCNDSRFRRVWAGPAFSWVSDHTVYTAVEPGAAPVGNAVRMDFDGYEHEYSDVMLQYVPVRPGATYAVSFASRREEPGDQTGLKLRVWASSHHWLMDVPAKLAMTWSTNRGVVRVPKRTAMLALAFTYSRPMGQIRLHNPVLIADVQLRELRP